MSARRTNSNPVSLFPFLAVLVSTMGALILLLLIITNQAQKQRERMASRRFQASTDSVGQQLPPLPAREVLPSIDPLDPYKPEPLIERALPELPKVEDPRSAIVVMRDQWLNRLAALRRNRDKSPSSDREQLETVQRSLDETEMLLKSLARSRNDAAHEAGRLRRTLTDVQKNLEVAKRAADHIENKYAVVPYTGPNGTKRRPIFLECRREGVILQPEGVVIDSLHLGNSRDPNNALAAVTQALATELKDDRAVGDPYPLFLVRPDGIETYYVAQRALESLNIVTGYEMLDTDVEVSFEPANDRIREIAQAAIRHSITSRSSFTRRSALSSYRGSRSSMLPGDRFDGGGWTSTHSKWRQAEQGRRGEDVEQIERQFDAGPAHRSSLHHRDASRLTLDSPWTATRQQTADALNRLRPSDSVHGRTVESGRSPNATHTDRRKGSGAREGLARADVSPFDGLAHPTSGPGGDGRYQGAWQMQQQTTGMRQPDSGGGSTASRSSAHFERGNVHSNREPGREGFGGRTSTDVQGGQHRWSEDLDADGPVIIDPAGIANGKNSSEIATPGDSLTSVAAGTAADAAMPNQARGSGLDVGQSVQGVQMSAGQRAAPGTTASLESRTSNLQSNSNGQMGLPTNAIAGMSPTQRSSPLAEKNTEEAEQDLFLFGDEASGGMLGVPGLRVSRHAIRRWIVVESYADGLVLHPGQFGVELQSDQQTDMAALNVYRHVVEEMQRWRTEGPMHRWKPALMFYVRPGGLRNYARMLLALGNLGIKIEYKSIDSKLQVRSLRW